MHRGAAAARITVTWTLVAVVAAVLAIPAVAWWGQEKLIFFPQPVGSTRHLPANAAALEIAADDGTKLRGWIVAAREARAPALIYFGGNAEEVSWTVADRRWPERWTRVALNYRGYGNSEGEPGEAALVADARTIYDAVAQRPDVDASRIVVAGRSLGTGVAVALAATRNVAGAVLISPYDSLAAVGRMHYPLLPVSLLLRHRFDSAALAPSIRAPMLAIVGAGDAIVPPARSRALADAWGGTKRWIAIEGADHNDLSEHEAFWRAIDAFLRDVAP